MHRVAATMLREVGLADEAGDVVHDAIVSIMKSPPVGVSNWEAFLVTAVKRRVLDRIRSAAVRHGHGGRRAGRSDDPEVGLAEDTTADLTQDLAQDVAEIVDRQRRSALAWDCLSVLDDRHRTVVWQCVALERPRREVARDLCVSPGRISQMITAALEQLRAEIIRREGDR